MKEFVLKRVVTGILAVLAVLIINFFLIYSSPGSPIRFLAGKDNPSEEMIQELEAKYGLDQPLTVQLFSYLKNISKGDFGHSIIQNESVLKLVGDTLGSTLILVLTATILALVIGTFLGVYASRHHGSKRDTFFSGLTYVLNSMPPFWLGIMLIMVFASWFKILPTSGMISVRENYEGFAYFIDVLKHLILPVITLTLIQIPTYFKLAQTTVLQVTREDFVRTFRAAGMSENKIFNKYVLKNVLLPIITVFGISLAYIVTGSALIEIVFSWPGTGRLMLDAVMQRDYPLLMGIYLIMAISIAVMMVITDIVYALVDPRIRYK